MLKRIEINGFRGIQSLSIEDFRRVNVFVGSNGGGKTSVLEAVCLASQPLNPQLLDALNRWRDMPPLNSQTWHTLLTAFSEMDGHRPIVLEIDTERGHASIEIRALFGRGRTNDSELAQDRTTTTAPDPSAISAGVEESVRGIKSVYRSSGGESAECALELIGVGYQQTVNVKLLTQAALPGSFFISTRRATSLAETAAALTELYAKNAEESFVSALKKVEPRIRRLIPGFQGNLPTVLADLGYATLVPISVIGDGFCRVSLIVTGIVSGKPGKLLIVDEIDSGLHRTVMGGLWESMVTLSRDYDFQVFCSTHNEEMLQETLPAFASEPDALRVYRLNRNGKGLVSPQMYDYQMLEDAQAMGMDVR